MADEKQFSFDLSGLPDRPEESQGKPIEFDLSRLPDQPESAARPSLRQGKEQPWTTLFSHGYLIGPGNTITGGAPNQKATQALGLAEQFDVTPSFAMDHIQELSEELVRRGRASLPEVAMVLGPVAFTVLAPYLRVLGWGAFEAVENIARLMNTSKGAIATGVKIAAAGEKAAKGLKILYGGSVDSKNAKLFAASKKLDGVLVGGASINYHQFSAIVDSGYRMRRELGAED